MADSANNPNGGEGRTDAGADLRAAWDEMLAELGRARDAVDNPRLYPPPPSARNLAEGYRYLLGFIYGAAERVLAEDPDFPYFRRCIPPFHKSTIDNSDNLYLSARIDGDATYVLTGRAQDHRHWRGEPPAPSGRKAPQYAIFTTISTYTGDSGSLAELTPSVTANTGMLDCSDLAVEPDGSFTILIGPRRPAGYAGNFIPTKSTLPWTRPDGTTVEIEHTAQYLIGRELFGDWEREDALDLHLVRTGAEGTHPRPADASTAARQMRRLGATVNHQMRFWNEYYAILLEAYGDMNGDGKRFMPRNDLNAPMSPSAQLGAAQATNIYSGGIYELGGNEALIVEQRIPVPALYTGFNLSNFWGESFDYANHVSSRNGCQAEVDADGVLRYVIAHRDPGVPNWIDTTGHPEGFIGLRWVYSQKPERLPTLKVAKVDFDDIRRHLPPGTRTVSADERRNEIRIRQEHVQRRYRQY